MKIFIVLEIFFLAYISHINADPILPSYARDEGDWPDGVDKTMTNVHNRWYIDTNDAQCKILEYRGTKGNFNNFASKPLCEKHKKLTMKEKLKGCKEAKHEGHCTGNQQKVEHYYFKSDTANCETFEYNGCGGSFNRYETDKECYQYCLNTKNSGLTNAQQGLINAIQNHQNYAVPNELDCDLDPDVTSDSLTTKFVADIPNHRCVQAAVTMTAETRGVFDDVRACVAKCFPHKHSDTDNTNKPTKRRKVLACEGNPHFYAVQGDGDGENSLVRYYYDDTAKKCKRMESGPPPQGTDFDKTKNNFASLDQCHSYCGAANYDDDEITTEETCTLGVAGNVAGNASFKIKRYYFDQANKKCKAFWYGGKGGNSNNFKTSAKCMTLCGNVVKGEDTITTDDTP